MIDLIARLIFGDRLDRMPMKEVERLGERGELTFSEVKRVIKLQRESERLR